MGTASEYTLRQILDALSGGIGLFPHQVWDIAGIIQVIENNSVENGQALVYVVPAGRVFYLTSIRVYFRNTTQTDRTGRLFLKDTEGVYIGEWPFDAPSLSTEGIVVPFAPPVKLEAGQTVYIYSDGAGMWTYATITGYTLPV